MKVLVSAYACEPGRGSEPGAGWHWAAAAAADHEVWVLTHGTNREPVTRALEADPELARTLHVRFVSNPAWLRWLRRDGRSDFMALDRISTTSADIEALGPWLDWAYHSIKS